MRASYFAATWAVISVRITPGLTSKTGMPSGASLTASAFAHMESPSFETQYWARSIETSSLLAEVMKTIAGLRSSGAPSIALATSGAAQINAHHEIVGFRRDLQHVAAHRSADASIGDEKIEPSEVPHHGGDKIGMAFEGCDIVTNKARTCAEMCQSSVSRLDSLVLDDVGEDDVMARFGES